MYGPSWTIWSIWRYVGPWSLYHRQHDETWCIGMVRNQRLRMDRILHHRYHLGPKIINKFSDKKRQFLTENGLFGGNRLSTVRCYSGLRNLRTFLNGIWLFKHTWTYWKAASMRPPLQPWFPSGFEQSTKFCSERSGSAPNLIFIWPSRAPVDENAQHDPHWPEESKILHILGRKRNFCEPKNSDFGSKSDNFGSKMVVLDRKWPLFDEKGKI